MASSTIWVEMFTQNSYEDGKIHSGIPSCQGHCCAHQCQTQHLNGGDVLSQEDCDFLRFHIRARTEWNYAYGWRRFSEFCNNRMVEPTVASVAIVVKFIVAMFKENLKYQTMNRAVSAISKHYVQLQSGETIAHHPLVQQAKKAFWQQRPPLPKYRCTYNASHILKYLVDLGENETLGLESLMYKTAFLVAFSTLSRYSY